LNKRGENPQVTKKHETFLEKVSKGFRNGFLSEHKVVGGLIAAILTMLLAMPVFVAMPMFSIWALMISGITATVAMTVIQFLMSRIFLGYWMYADDDLSFGA
jgi:ABC-type proline/glycine betaine transport system permease subunit